MFTPFFVFCFIFFFFFKQKTAYEIRLSLVGSEMCIRDSLPPNQRALHDYACRSEPWRGEWAKASHPSACPPPACSHSPLWEGNRLWEKTHQWRSSPACSPPPGRT